MEIWFIQKNLSTSRDTFPLTKTHSHAFFLVAAISAARAQSCFSRCGTRGRRLANPTPSWGSASVSIRAFLSFFSLEPLSTSCGGKGGADSKDKQIRVVFFRIIFPYAYVFWFGSKLKGELAGQSFLTITTMRKVVLRGCVHITSDYRGSCE